MNQNRRLAAPLLLACGLLVACLVLASCSRSPGTASAPAVTTTTQVIETTTTFPVDVTVASLHLAENQLLAALASPLQAFRLAAADYEQAQAQSNQALSGAVSSNSVATQNATATCQQDGYGSTACQAALGAMSNQAVANGNSSISASSQFSQRASADTQAEQTALGQIGAAYLAAATSAATIRFPPTAQDDGAKVEAALTGVATASQLASTGGSNSPATQAAVSAFTTQFNNLRVALAALHADLGLGQPPTGL